jgi:uncharacterized protein (TIGR03435 family)
VVFVACATCLYPQGKPQSRAGFEVAAIRPNNSGIRGETRFQISPGGVVATNFTLKWLVQRAYGIEEFKIYGGPAWFNNDRFDVTAKASTEVSGDQLMLMLQALLADRFRLKLHREQRELPSYALVVDKSGAKLKTSAEGEPSQPVQLNPLRLAGKGVSMAKLATALSNAMGQTVVDQTGLSGDYDFSVEWKFEPGAVPNQPGFFDPLIPAMREQLGLMLEERKRPTPVLVIDEAQKPSEN